MRHYEFRISDYEHSGDLDWAKNYVKKKFPLIENVKTHEERDYEAEAEYEDEHGECDEPIYQGYIEFDAPADYMRELQDFSL